MKLEKRDHMCACLCVHMHASTRVFVGTCACVHVYTQVHSLVCAHVEVRSAHQVPLSITM